MDVNEKGTPSPPPSLTPIGVPSKGAHRPLQYIYYPPLLALIQPYHTQRAQRRLRHHYYLCTLGLVTLYRCAARVRLRVAPMSQPPGEPPREHIYAGMNEYDETTTMSDEEPDSAERVGLKFTHLSHNHLGVHDYRSTLDGDRAFPRHVPTDTDR